MENNVKPFPPQVNPQAAKAAAADPASASFGRILANIQARSAEMQHRSGYIAGIDAVMVVFRTAGVLEDATPEQRLRFIGALLSLACQQDEAMAVDIAKGAVTWP